MRLQFVPRVGALALRVSLRKGRAERRSVVPLRSAAEATDEHRTRARCSRSSRPSRADPRRARERPPSATRGNSWVLVAIAVLDARHERPRRAQRSQFRALILWAGNSRAFYCLIDVHGDLRVAARSTDHMRGTSFVTEHIFVLVETELESPAS